MEITSKTASLVILALLSITLGIAALPIFFSHINTGLENGTAFYKDNIHNINGAVDDIQFPDIIAENQKISLNETFDPLQWASASDMQDGDITAMLECYGEVDNTRKGEYTVRYCVRNSYGLKSTKHIQVIVD